MVFVEILAVLVLVLVNGALAMSELAIVTARRSRLRALVDSGNRRARIALGLIDDPTTFLSTVQIGITMVGVLAGAVSGATLADRFGDWLDRWPMIAPYGDPIALGLVVVAITYLSLVFGELVPKGVALQRPETIALAVAPAMRRLARFARPAVWLLRISTDRMIGALGLGQRRESGVTEDEVRMLIAEGVRAGVFVAREREMIEGVLRLADRRVRAIMTPRSEVVWLDERATPEEVGALISAHGYASYPVCRESIDQPVGVIELKKLAPALLRHEPLVLSARMQPPLLVPETVLALKVLDMLRSEGAQLAVVVDEYGTTQGVVTVTDILEAITGELPEPGEEPEMSLHRREDGSWLVDGAYPIDEFEDRVGLRGLRGDDADFETVAGFVLHHLGSLPRLGESFEAAGGRFEVVDLDGRRIDKVLYTPAAPAYDGDWEGG